MHVFLSLCLAFFYSFVVIAALILILSNWEKIRDFFKKLKGE